MSILREFREFIARGNVLDLAIAVVLGVAFTAVVDAFTQGVLMNLIAALVGRPSFDDIVLHVGATPILIGRFLTALVSFLLVAVAVFAIVKANDAIARRRVVETEREGESDHQLLTQIRDALRDRREPA